MNPRSTYVAVDGVEFDFRPRRAAKISLVVCTVTSFAALVFLIRAGVCWVEFSTGEVVLLAFTAIAWTVFSISSLVTIYARSLPPTETWLWEATKRIIACLSLLWFATFCLCVTLTSRVFYHALRCTPSSDECTELSHRIAIEVYASSAISLAVALATTIFVSIDLHIHRWLGLFPTPRPVEEGWSTRPLLATRQDGGMTRRGIRKSAARPVFAYSEEEDRQSPFEDSPQRSPALPSFNPSATSTSYPPAFISQSYITRAKTGLPLSPSLAASSSTAAPFFSTEPSLLRPSSQLPPPGRYSSVSQSTLPDVGTFFSPGKHDSSTRRRHGGSTTDETAPSTRTSGTSRPSETETEEETEEEAARIKAEEEKKARRRRRAARRKKREASKNAAGSTRHHHHHRSSDASSDHDDERYKRKRKQAGLNATSSSAQSAVNSALINSGGGGDADGGASAS